MKLVFCSDPLEPMKPDSAYAAEAMAAERLGLDHAVISYEALVDANDPVKAVRRVAPQATPDLGLYRGWMLTPEKYSQLYAALADRGIHLINDPEAYRHCHYLPESYPLIEPYTPRSVWLKTGAEVSMPAVMELLRPFGPRAVIVKDFVKSRKHEWDEACYIPSASNWPAVERIVRRFLELQGEDLNEGLVFREFIEFEPLTRHSKSGMPLTKEFRLFFLDGEPLCSMEYWEEGDYAGAIPPVDQFRSVARKVRSRFYTMDVAMRIDGEWMIVELGDGQVAGLPDHADVTSLYRALLDHWPGKNL